MSSKPDVAEELSEPTDLKGKVEVTGQHMIQRLREAVSPPGKKGLWLRKLNDKQLAEVYHRLKLGQKTSHIVRIAQVEWGIMRRSQPCSLNRGVLAFKEKVVGELQQEAHRLGKEAGKRFIDKTTQKGARALQKLDSIGRLRWLIEVQTERLELLYTREKTVQIPLKMTEKTVEVLGLLLEKLIKFEIDLGLRDARPQELELRVKHYFDRLLAGEEAAGGGNTMLIAANKLIEDLSKDSVLMTVYEDGAYAVEDKDVASGARAKEN
jgi:hypothetical protein